MECACVYKACLHLSHDEHKEWDSGHLLVGKKRRRAVLGILLKLEGLLGPAYCLQMHPHITLDDMRFSAEAFRYAGFALLQQHSILTPTDQPDTLCTASQYSAEAECDVTLHICCHKAILPCLPLSRMTPSVQRGESWLPWAYLHSPCCSCHCQLLPAGESGSGPCGQDPWAPHM